MAFSAFLADNDAALTMLFEPAQMQTLRDVELAMKRAALSLAPLSEPAPGKKSLLRRIFG